MSGEVRIRGMEWGDLDGVMALADGLAEAPHWPRIAYEAALEAGNGPERIALGAEGQEGRLEGGAVGSLAGGEAELESIAVAQDRQRRGVGRRLFGELAQRLRERGASAFFLEVRAANQAALGLYRALGLEASGLRKGYYGSPPEDAIVFRLQLEGVG